MVTLEKLCVSSPVKLALGKLENVGKPNGKIVIHMYEIHFMMMFNLLCALQNKAGCML